MEIENRVVSDDDDEEQGENNDSTSTASFTSFPLPVHARHSLVLDQLLFFMAGLGSSLGYIASLSSLVYFQQLLGDNFFVSLNLAVFVPLVPISIAQALWDQQYDQFYATQRTFVVRGVVAYFLIVLGTLGMILLFQNKNDKHIRSISVIACAFLQGTGGAILYGQLNQLASFMTKNGFDNGGRPTDPEDTDASSSTMPKKFKATVSAGVQASALVALLLSWTSQFGTMNASRFVPFLWSNTVVVVFCFACLLWLLLANRRVRASMVHRDSSIRRGTSSSITPLLPLRMTSSGSYVGNEENTNDGSATTSLQQPLLPARQQQQQQSSSLPPTISLHASSNNHRQQPTPPSRIS